MENVTNQGRKDCASLKDKKGRVDPGEVKGRWKEDLDGLHTSRCKRNQTSVWLASVV